MKSIAILFLAVSVVAAENLQCTPGAFFKIDCNTCVCSSDGLSAACTDMACPREGNANVNDIETIRARQLRCTPNSIFSPDNCNICKCSADGMHAGCTLKLCPQPEVQSAQVRRCEPNSIFSPDNCNICKCSEDGLKSACTLKLCPQNKEVKPICKPRSHFQDYCNTCTCSDDGSTYSCTRMNCDKDIWNQDGSLKVDAKTVLATAENQVCSPNTQFKEQCNSCVCSADGLSKACTMMACDDQKDEAPLETTAPVCEAGKAYSPDGCNTCICNPYGTTFACTLRLCLPNIKSFFKDDESEKWGPLYRQGDACTPGKAFYSECNQCVCTDSGRSAFCTIMFCPTKSMRN